MLVLSRKPNQSIMMIENHLSIYLKVTVFYMARGRQIRLGIHAPKNIKVYREELLTPEQLSIFHHQFNDRDHPLQQSTQLVNLSSELVFNK